MPNWPVVVAMATQDIAPDEPAVTQKGRRVHVVSAVARRFGIRRNMSLRGAQELCPSVHVLEEDENLCAREFEFITQVVEELVPHVEILRPGLLLFAARGPAKYYGTEEGVGEVIVETLADRAQCEAHVGTSNGILAAILAARTLQIVPEEQTHDFLGPRPLADLLYAVTNEPQRVAVEQFLSLQHRLGIKTFGDLAVLPQAHVHTRFGATGAWAHQLASGQDIWERTRERQEPDITVSQELDPPIDRVDMAAFAARQLAQELHDLLLGRAVTCSRIEIVATTESGTQLERTWRTDDSALGAMSAARITQRVRWQLEGWLTASKIAHNKLTRTDTPPPATTLTRISLTAQYVQPTAGHQEKLWGQSGGHQRRAQGAALRVQDLLGPQAVLAVVPTGGRTYQERVSTPWWSVELDTAATTEQASWPGQLPSPAPASLKTPPWDIEVLDKNGLTVTFNNRLGLSAQPHAVIKTDSRWPEKDNLPIMNWAGPWPIRTNWWTTDAQHCIYVQLVLDQEPALLAVFRSGAWQCEGIYD